MNIKKHLILVKEILENSPYQRQKDTVQKIFNTTINESARNKILMRLIVIDSCYSTNMDRRLFGFEELTDEIILQIDSELNEDIDVSAFIDEHFKSFKKNIGIHKNGKEAGHAFSLLSKYIYFKTNYKFPIYDSMVLKGLKSLGLVNKSFDTPSEKYFKILLKLAKKHDIAIDELDQYFWVTEKLKAGNPSLLLSDAKEYNDFLDVLNLSKNNKGLKSSELSNEIAHRLKDLNVKFTTRRLQLIHELAKAING